jgi:hypothetical protein
MVLDMVLRPAGGLGDAGSAGDAKGGGAWRQRMRLMARIEPNAGERKAGTARAQCAQKRGQSRVLKLQARSRADRIPLHC